MANQNPDIDERKTSPHTRTPQPKYLCLYTITYVSHPTLLIVFSPENNQKLGAVRQISQMQGQNTWVHGVLSLDMVNLFGMKKPVIPTTLCANRCKVHPQTKNTPQTLKKGGRGGGGGRGEGQQCHMCT